MISVHRMASRHGSVQINGRICRVPGGERRVCGGHDCHGHCDSSKNLPPTENLSQKSHPDGITVNCSNFWFDVSTSRLRVLYLMGLS